MHIKKSLVKSDENLIHLCTKLNFLFEFLDKTYKINSGGCCYVTSILAKLLEEDDIEFSVIVYNCDYENFFDIDCSQFHYTLKIDKYLVNYYEDDGDYAEFFDVTSEDLDTHYRECYWNDCYNIEFNDYIRGIIINFYNNFTNDLREE